MQIISINIKAKTEGEHGLPKQPILEAHISDTYVANDYNIYRMESKGNTKDRAVLIYTKDMLDTLNTEGWALKPGDIGENLTIDGLKYEEIELGDRLIIGDVILEISEICNPCMNLAVLPYVGKEKMNQFIITMKGRRGWYARVLQTGKVHTGDIVHFKRKGTL